MGSPRHRPVEDPQVWLGVREASVMLGVSPATLRRWSAAGKVRAFTTPGGHRRFAESTIRELLGAAAGPEPSARGLGESAERILGRVDEQFGPACLGSGWTPASGPGERVRLAGAVRSVVEGLLGYVDGRTAAERDAALRPALEAAARHGKLAGEHHGDLAETVEALHRLRALVVDDLVDLACLRGLATPEATHLIARLNEGVDRLVAGLVEAHAAALASRGC